MRQLMRRSARTSRAAKKGVTLIELMVGVAVLVTLLSLAAPPLATMVTNHRLLTDAQTLQTTAIRARGEAIKRNETVRLSSDGAVLRIVMRPGQATEEELASVPLVLSGQSNAFSLDYASNGLTLPFGEEETITWTDVAGRCGKELRCPTLTLGAGGTARLCPTGVCS